MSANSLLGIGTSGLIAYQNAMSISGNNIENAYTVGYNRKNAQLSENFYNGQGYGVSLSGVERIYNHFLTTQLRNCISNFNATSVYKEKIVDLDNYLNQESSNIDKSMQTFFSNIELASTQPNSLSSRQMVINSAESLVNNIVNTQTMIDQQYNDVNKFIQNSAEQINKITAGIAELNSQLSSTKSETNSIMDQRDNLLNELAELVSFNIIEKENGNIDILTNSGNPLVLSSISSTVTAKASASDNKAFELQVTMKDANTSIPLLTEGGQVGGMIKYRKEVLDKFSMDLNKTVAVFTDKINSQHAKGMNQNDKLGGNFFSDINSENAIHQRVNPNSNNTGDGSFTVVIDESSNVESSLYEIKFADSTNFTVTRMNDNQEVYSGVASNQQTTFAVDGFTTTIDSGNFYQNDRFIIQPSNGIIDNLKVTITSPENVALASPLHSNSDSGNTGNAKLSLVSITDITNPSFSQDKSLSPPIKIEYDGQDLKMLSMIDGSVLGVSHNYDPISGKELFPTDDGFDPGYQFTLTGEVNAGDAFYINYNTGGVGDNFNALKIADIQLEQLMNNHTTTIQNNYQTIENSITSKAYYQTITEKSSEFMLNEYQSERDNYSGVNIDEEIAKLVAYQQSYQASAELISIANNVFNTLIDIIG